MRIRLLLEAFGFLVLRYKSIARKVFDLSVSVSQVTSGHDKQTEFQIICVGRWATLGLRVLIPHSRFRTTCAAKILAESDLHLLSSVFWRDKICGTKGQMSNTYLHAFSA